MMITRFNPMGLRYSLTEAGKDKTTIKLVGTEKELTVDFSLERLSAMWWKWQQKGEYIQQAFNELPPEHREFLMTGITPKEWDQTFYDRVPNIEFCRSKSVCQETGKCEAIRKYDRSCND